jgi:hypothetical protein
MQKIQRKLKILQGMREDDVNPGETDLERILFEQQQGGIPTVNEFVWRDIFSKAAEIQLMQNNFMEHLE